MIFKPKNPEVYWAVMEFVTRATDFLNKLLVEGKQIPLTIEEEPIIDEHGFHGEKYLETPNYFRFMREHEDELKKLKEFKIGIEVVSRNVLVKEYYQGRITDSAGRIIENPNIRPFVGVDFFISSLIRLIEQTRSLRFDEKIFNGLYQSLEKRMLYGEERIYHYYAPLLNFDSEVERLELEGNITICKISPSKLRRIWRLARFAGTISRFQLNEIRYVIEMSYKHPKSLPINDEIPRKTFERVVSSLRLFKKGVLGFNILCHDAGASLQGFAPREFFGARYVLESAEAKEFLAFWRFFKEMTELKRLKKDRFLDISIRRFNRALDEHFPEDKLVDLIIALEALYLTEVDELSYRLALRSSILLSEEGKEEEIRELMTKAYRIRNNIVHGKTVKSIKIQEQRMTLPDLVMKVENCVRRSIVAFLKLRSQMKNHKSIIDKLEKAIGNSSLRAELRRIKNTIFIS